MNKYRYYLSVIIPAFNEEKKIEKDIREIFSWFNKNSVKGEVIISTDGVTDGTNSIVRALQQEFKTLTLLAEHKKIGKGAAVKSGVRVAQGKYIMFADAGYCVPFTYIKDGINKLQSGYDVAFASRGLKESRIIIKQAYYRIISGKIFGLVVRTFIGLPGNITDTQCGFKIYKNETAKKLFNRIKTKGGLFDLELVLLAKKMNYRQAEFPVAWRNDPDTKYNVLVNSFIDLKDLFKIKFIYKL